MRNATILLFLGGVLGSTALWEATQAGGPKVKVEKTSLRADLALVPSNAVTFVHIRPTDVWNSPIGKQLRQHYPKQAEVFYASLQLGLDFDIANVEAVTFVSMNAQSLGRPFDFLFDRRFNAEAVKPAQAEIKDPKEEPKKPPKDKDEKVPGKVKEEEQPKDLPIPGPPEDDFSTPADLMIVSRSKPINRAKVLKAVGGAVEKKYMDKTYYVAAKKVLGYSALYLANDKLCVYASTEKELQKMFDHVGKGGKGRSLAPALELAAKKHPVVIGFDLLRKEADELKQDLRNFLGALEPLLEVRSTAFAITSLQDKGEVLAHLQFPDEKKAKNAVDAAQDALALFRIFALGISKGAMLNDLEDAETPEELHAKAFWILAVKQAEATLRQTKVEVQKARLNASVEIRFDADKLHAEAKTMAKELLGDEAFRIARQRRISRNNLEKIGNAFQAYHDAFKTFPAQAICREGDGKPLLSWRVQILPYIDQGELYNQFKKDEPWDSPDNIKLLPKMPKIYAPVGVKTKEPHTTFYQGFTGPGAGFELKLGARGGLRIVDITDGTSNTLAVVEAGDAVPWSKPADLEYDEKKLLPKLGGIFKDGFNALFFDASVSFIRNTVDQKVLRAAITYAGGEASSLR